MRLTWIPALLAEIPGPFAIGAAFTAIPIILGAWTRFGNTDPNQGRNAKEDIENLKKEVTGLRADLATTLSAAERREREREAQRKAQMDELIRVVEASIARGQAAAPAPA